MKFTLIYSVIVSTFMLFFLLILALSFHIKLDNIIKLNDESISFYIFEVSVLIYSNSSSKSYTNKGYQKIHTNLACRLICVLFFTYKST